MFKKTLIALTLPLLFLLVVAASLCRGAPGWLPTTARRHSAVATTPATDGLQKMMVENESVTMDLGSQRVEWRQLSGGKTRHTAIRRGSQLLLFHFHIETICCTAVLTRAQWPWFQAAVDSVEAALPGCTKLRFAGDTPATTEPAASPGCGSQTARD